MRTLRQSKTPRGFSLTELMLLMLLSIFISLGISSLLVQISQQLHLQTQQEILSTSLQQLLYRVIQSLQRAGFIYPVHTNQHSKTPLPLETPVVISHHPQEEKNSCVLLYYDMNRNGRIDGGTATAPAETEGYRLHQGNLEMQRGVTDCAGHYWEDLNEPSQVFITTFSVTRLTDQPGVYVHIHGHLTRFPHITYAVNGIAHLENICSPCTDSR